MKNTRKNFTTRNLINKLRYRGLITSAREVFALLWAINKLLHMELLTSVEAVTTVNSVEAAMACTIQ